MPCSFLYKVPSVFCTGLSPNSQDVLCYPFSLFVLHLSHTTDLDSHSYSVIRSRYSYSTSPTLQTLTAIRTPLFVLVIRTTKIQTLTAIRTPLSVLVIRTVARVNHPKHPSARTTDLDSHLYSVIRSRYSYYENTDFDSHLYSVIRSRYSYCGKFGSSAVWFRACKLDSCSVMS